MKSFHLVQSHKPLHPVGMVMVPRVMLTFHFKVNTPTRTVQRLIEKIKRSEEKVDLILRFTPVTLGLNDSGIAARALTILLVTNSRQGTTWVAVTHTAACKREVISHEYERNNLSLIHTLPRLQATLSAACKVEEISHEY